MRFHRINNFIGSDNISEDGEEEITMVLDNADGGCNVFTK